MGTHTTRANAMSRDGLVQAAVAGWLLAIMMLVLILLTSLGVGKSGVEAKHWRQHRAGIEHLERECERRPGVLHCRWTDDGEFVPSGGR